MAPQAASRQDDAIGPSRDRQGAEAGRASASSTESRTAGQAAKADEAATNPNRNGGVPTAVNRDWEGVNHGPAGRQSE